MTSRNSIRNLIAGAGTAFCLCASFQASPAQTDYSLRLYSLGIHLAGIVEDAHTDIYLNPARAGLIERPEVFGVNLPRRGVTIPFPISTWYLQGQFAPVETYISSYSYSPIALNYLVPLGARFRASFGFEAAVSNEDDMGTDRELSIEYDDALRDYSRYSRRRQQVDHAALNAACALPVGSGYAGVRFEAEYDVDEYHDISDRLELRMRMDGGNDTYFTQSYESSSSHYEMTSFALSAGLHRPRRLISDAVIGCGLRRSLLPVSSSAFASKDEDYDGDGEGFFGSTPDNYYRETAYDSRRDYRGLSLYGRVHLQLTETLRTVHLLLWSSNHGDGALAFHNISDELDAKNLFDHRLECASDGDYSTLYLSSAIGRSGEIHDGVSLFLGAKGVVTRRIFEERAPGNFATAILNESLPDTFFVSGAYTQSHDREEIYYYLIAPVALEWNPRAYLGLRLGVAFTAMHRDMENYYEQTVPIEGAPAAFDDRRGFVDYSLIYSTGVSFSNGLTINIRDTLILDLFYGYSSSISVDSFNYLSIRYLF